MNAIVPKIRNILNAIVGSTINNPTPITKRRDKSEIKFTLAPIIPTDITATPPVTEYISSFIERD